MRVASIRSARAHLALVVALLSAGPARAEPTPTAEAQAPEVAIVLPPAPISAVRAASRRLLDELGPAAVLRTSTSASELSALVRAARAWPEVLVVWIDAPSARVTVARPADGTVLSRPLAPSIVEGSPYVVSETALELLEVARSLARPREVAPARGFFAVSLSASFAVTATPGGHEGPLLWPRLVASLRARPTETPWWGAVGAGVQLLGERDGPVDEVERLDYARDDLFVQVAGGRTWRRLELSVAAEAGASLARARVIDDLAQVLADDRRVGAWLGGGLELAVRLGAGVAASLGAGGAYVLTPSRYFIGERLALEEARVRGRAQVGLTWTWPD